MKSLIKMTLSASVFLVTALTASKSLGTDSDHFMSCSGAHHGWYLDFFAVSPFGGEVVEVNIVVSTDAGPEESPYQIYQISSLEKNYASIQTKAYRWVLKQAVTEGFKYGYVKVKADGAGIDSQMYLNFNIFGDSKIESAVFIDGDIQSLTCVLN